MKNRLKEVKEQIAKELNYKDWEHCINDQPNFGVEKVMDMVALRLWNSSLQLNESETMDFENWKKKLFEEHEFGYINKHSLMFTSKENMIGLYKTMNN